MGAPLLSCLQQPTVIRLLSLLPELNKHNCATARTWMPQASPAGIVARRSHAHAVTIPARKHQLTLRSELTLTG